MKIEVTARDIKLGMAKSGMASCDRCPVARAFRKAGIKNANVGTSAVWVHGGEQYNIPVKVSKVIGAMCERKIPKPFSFTIPDKIFKAMKEGN